nr:AraC family transcriptional regulator [Roseobacter litoralis]
MSTYNFARVFRTAMGRSPHQYVVERRLADAKRRLSQSDKPLAVIAHVSGFSSKNHMTDTFKKILDVTPGVVRKNSNQSKTARVGDDFYQDLAHGGDQRVVWFVLVVFGA